MRNILSSALIALMMTGMAYPVAAEEAQTASEAYSIQAEMPVETPEHTAAAVPPEPSSEGSDSDAPQVQHSAAGEPRGNDSAGPEAIDETELVEIADQEVPLAGGQAPSVTVRACHDVGALQIGDRLVLACELRGFDGLEYKIRWQALVNGQWKDLSGENAETLSIRITRENAGWSYRAAVDAKPA